MSQTEIPRIEADDPNHQPSGNSGIGRQPEGSSFWSSMPRVLTALGGVVTALGTVAAVYFGGVRAGGGDGPAPGPSPVSPGTQIVVLDGRAAPAPAVQTSASSASSRSSGVLSGRETASSSSEASEIVAEWEDTLDADAAAITDGCAQGYSSDCQELLEMLVDECEYGYGISCDVLFLISPSGSALEDYGNSCGGRVPENDEWCSDLARR